MKLLASTAKLPDPPPEDLSEDSVLRPFLSSFKAALLKALNDRSPDIQVRSFLFIKSPAGKVFQVVVDDNGNLSTTLKASQ